MREVDSASKQAYKPDSVPLTGWRSSIWDARYRAPHAAYPEVKGNEQLPVPEGTPSCLALLPVGVAWPALSPAPPVVSYTTFSPLRPGSLIRGSLIQGRGLFLWPFPRVAPPGCYPASPPVESGLSSPGMDDVPQARPPGRLRPLALHIHYTRE